MRFKDDGDRLCAMLLVQGEVSGIRALRRFGLAMGLKGSEVSQGRFVEEARKLRVLYAFDALLRKPWDGDVVRLACSVASAASARG